MKERSKVSEGRFTFLLLVVMLVSAAWSISAARWTDGLGHLAVAAIVALVAGLLLAKSRFPAPIAHLFNLAYGLFAVGYLVGKMVEQATWHERVIELSERSVIWLTKATSGGTSRDSLMFVLLLTGLFWLLGHVAAWYTFRRPRLWRVILPIGLTMLVNEYVYTDPRIATRSTASLAPFLITFLLAALLYAVRTNVYLRELRWQSSFVNYNTEVRLDFVRSGTILALVALLVMAIAPGAKAGTNVNSLWSGIEDMRKSVRDTVARLFSSLDVESRAVANPFSGRLVLGGPRSLGDSVLFDVQAPDGRYWRAVAYDLYTGDDWINTDDHTVLLPPGYPTTTEAWQLREEVTQTVTLYLPGSTQLFAAPEPVRVLGLSTRASISFVQDEMTPPSTLYSEQTLRPGNIYQVISSVSSADPDSLRRAGESYPAWIEERYLQLPDTVTERTRALAEEITAGKETPFDKAQAIEEYLRQNLRYDLGVPAPPEGQDFVDFVLFDLQTGYCDYYSSSFAVLARSIGLPTRVVGGYAQDQYDADAGAYRVRARNGHSWPEVYFPAYGWIQFEPTVIIDPIDWPEPSGAATTDPTRPRDPSLSDPESLLDERDELLAEEPEMPPGAGLDLPVVDSSEGVSPAFWILIGVGLTAGLGVVIAYWASELRGMSGLSLVERAYARMWRFAAWLGVPNPPDQTPYERAQALATLVPEGQSSITHIADLYVVERFSPDNGGGDDADAEDKWALLRPMLWKSWLEKRFSRLQRQDMQRRWQRFRETGSSETEQT